MNQYDMADPTMPDKATTGADVVTSSANDSATTNTTDSAAKAQQLNPNIRVTETPNPLSQDIDLVDTDGALQILQKCDAELFQDVGFRGLPVSLWFLSEIDCL